MHLPGRDFFCLQNPERCRAEDHRREKQNFRIEPDDAQSVGDENAKPDREPRPSLAEKNRDCPNSVRPIAFDIFQILDGKRNRESQNQKPKNLMGETRDILSVSQKHKAGGKKQRERERRKKTGNNRKSFEPERPGGIYPADSLIDQDYQKEFHADGDGQDQRENKTYPEQLAIIFPWKRARRERSSGICYFINRQILAVIEKYRSEPSKNSCQNQIRKREKRKEVDV